MPKIYCAVSLMGRRRTFYSLIAIERHRMLKTTSTRIECIYTGAPWWRNCATTGVSHSVFFTLNCFLTLFHYTKLKYVFRGKYLYKTSSLLRSPLFKSMTIRIVFTLNPCSICLQVMHFTHILDFLGRILRLVLKLGL